MELNGRSGSGRTRPLIYQARQDENANIDPAAVFLRESAPRHWRELMPLVGSMTEDIDFLSWQDRAFRIDAIVWERARLMLNSDQITAVINRISHSHGRCYAIVEYANCVSSLVNALLMQINDSQDIQSVHHALTLALSTDNEHRSAASDWMTEQSSPRNIEQALAMMPGYAFATMTIYDNDAVESFQARDAFWKAMLGG